MLTGETLEAGWNILDGALVLETLRRVVYFFFFGALDGRQVFTGHLADLRVLNERLVKLVVCKQHLAMLVMMVRGDRLLALIVGEDSGCGTVRNRCQPLLLQHLIVSIGVHIFAPVVLVEVVRWTTTDQLSVSFPGLLLVGLIQLLAHIAGKFPNL